MPDDGQAKVGDGVIYHGVRTEYHGLYVVAGAADGKYVLASPDAGIVLYDAPPTTFELLLSR